MLRVIRLDRKKEEPTSTVTYVPTVCCPLPFEGVSGYLRVSFAHTQPLEYETPRISFSPEFFPSGFLDV
jgi:hypothetical protein